LSLKGCIAVVSGELRGAARRNISMSIVRRSEN
jgi:hypothetical protein